nr:doublesex and mab 3 transcription [Hymenolepis microstoma]
MPTTQRLSFHSDQQQISQPVPMIQDPPNQQQPLSVYQSPTNKFRSQSGLIELLGTRTVKSSSNPISPKSETELKPQQCDENGANAMADNNAVPRSSYMCRKCRAHGHLIAVRQHKRNCPYKHCSCSVCSLVNYGRHIVARQIALYRDQKNNHNDEGSNLGRGSRGDKSRGPDKNDSEDEGPHCRRCRNHGKTNPWKGHKKVCPFYYCICQQCILITLRKSNEKNLREVVQESYKELGLKTSKKQQISENTSFPAPFYNKKTTKSGQEKQPLNQEHELPPAYQDSYGLRWRNQESGIESVENNAGFLQTNVQQQNDFYNVRAHHAAAFAAAAAAAVAFRQENVVTSIDSTLPLKEESHMDCGAQSMGQVEYPLQDNWICGNEIKCTLSPKSITPTQMEGFPGHNGFNTFWQSGPLQPIRSEEQMRTGKLG